MAPNAEIMTAVEQLDYRVTAGDVAARIGIDVRLAEHALLALASDTQGHLQVADTGDVVYLFPRSFRTILRNKYLRLRLQGWWNKLWRVLFYLIRISFGILLLLSILLIFAAILIITIAASSNNSDNDSRDNDSGGGTVIMPSFYWPDLYWIFYPDYGERRRALATQTSDDRPRLNFLEAIFSFLFGDGDPNADLEERRWRAIATVIRNQRGAVIAEQIAPYLDDLGTGFAQEYEEYMLPVLTRFNGRPEVSPDGQLVYHFPDLQTTAIEQQTAPVTAYLKEFPWRFSQASAGQVLLAIGLGALNLIGAVVLYGLLADGTAAAELGGLVAFVQSIFWVLLGYGVAFLSVPLIRYFWVQWRNRGVNQRNDQRQLRAIQLNELNATVQQKLAYAQAFARETVITQDNLAYTTEKDLIAQEAEHPDKIDAEWQQRLRGESS